MRARWLRLRCPDEAQERRMRRNPFDLRGYSAVLYKELRHVVRDPATLILAVAPAYRSGNDIRVHDQHQGGARSDCRAERISSKSCAALFSAAPARRI